MSSPLLDKFKLTSAVFRPTTSTDLLALRLAQRLNEPKLAHHYVTLTDSCSQAQLLRAYRRTIRLKTPDLGRTFHEQLKQTGAEHYGETVKLIAIRVERRTIAAAIFDGERLEFADSRQLSSDNERAVGSALNFVGWLLNRFPVASAALEATHSGEYQRRSLHDRISEALRREGLPIWEVPKRELLYGYGQPAVRSRADLRKIATTIWPVLAGTHARLYTQDAAILGLHVQTERLFILN